MESSFSNRFKKNMITIYPGEFYASDQDEVIQTLLGSCVAVCLYDPTVNVSGMNHYMLEGKILSIITHTKSSDKHALQSISRLIESMVQLGCKRKNLTAKVFGGGKVLNTENNIHTVPQDNIRAAKLILEMEDIHITQEETGGKFTRKVLMEVHNGKTFVKRSINSSQLKND
jgi:chemotaxis protein CheD